jgi:hypothetical protein
MSFTPIISYENLLYHKIFLCKYEKCTTNSYIRKSNSGSTVTVHRQIFFVPRVKFKTNLLHNTFICYLMLWHVLALTIGNHQGAFFSMCCLYCNLYVKNTAYDKILLWWLDVTILEISITVKIHLKQYRIILLLVKLLHPNVYISLFLSK